MAIEHFVQVYGEFIRERSNSLIRERKFSTIKLLILIVMFVVEGCFAGGEEYPLEGDGESYIDQDREDAESENELSELENDEVDFPSDSDSADNDNRFNPYRVTQEPEVYYLDGYGFDGEKIVWIRSLEFDGKAVLYDVGGEYERVLPIPAYSYHPTIANSKIGFSTILSENTSYVYDDETSKLAQVGETNKGADLILENNTYLAGQDLVFDGDDWFCPQQIFFSDGIEWIELGRGDVNRCLMSMFLNTQWAGWVVKNPNAFSWGMDYIQVVDLSDFTEVHKALKVQRSMRFPRISGDRMVWSDGQNGMCTSFACLDTDIYLMNLNNGKPIQITDNPADQSRPDIDGNWVVWQDARNAESPYYLDEWDYQSKNSDIYLYNIETGKTYRLTEDQHSQIVPKISYPYVIWLDGRHRSLSGDNIIAGWDLYLLDISKLDLDALEVHIDDWEYEKYVETPLNPIEIEWIDIEGGSFVMGDDNIDEEFSPFQSPSHSVDVSSFRISRFETTNYQYRKCIDSGKCTAPKLPRSRLKKDYFSNERYADHPVVYVSWNQAVEFCEWIGGRLPTEAEWEYAATGSMDWDYPWGSDPIDECGNSDEFIWGCSNDTEIVGRHPGGASPFGVENLADNVLEWVSDWFEETYGGLEHQDPTGPQQGTFHTARGMWFMHPYPKTWYHPNRMRHPFWEKTQSYKIGFRCVQSSN